MIKDLKSVKDTDNLTREHYDLTVFFMLLGSRSIKAVHRTLMKLSAHQVVSVPVEAIITSLSKEKFEEKNNQIVGKGLTLIIGILSLSSFLILSVSV